MCDRSQELEFVSPFEIRTDRMTDRQRDGRADGQMEGQTDGMRTDGSGQTERQLERQTASKIPAQLNTPTWLFFRLRAAAVNFKAQVSPFRGGVGIDPEEAHTKWDVVGEKFDASAGRFPCSQSILCREKQLS